jgi:AAA domain/Bifunctional DNA primase/polymerase, N-terminal
MRVVPADEAPLLSIALRALAAGLSVVPAREDGSKRPDLIAWKQYQQRQPTQDEVRRWFSRPRAGIGIFTGLGSGSLEMLEFEGRAVELGVWDAYKETARTLGLLPLLTRVMRGLGERSPTGGIHLYWRCPEIEGNLRLASTADEERLIETRGQGGFVVIAPSSGPTHPTGRPYELLTGSFEEIVIISPEERRDLLDLARSFDMRERAERGNWERESGEPRSRPGDDFNERGEWARDVLEPAGWRRTGIHAGREHWYRKQDGGSRWVSATISPDSRWLYCFSTSTPLPPERGLSKFAAFTYLHHEGDFEVAARTLRENGYGGGEGSEKGEIRGFSFPVPSVTPTTSTLGGNKEREFQTAEETDSGTSFSDTVREPELSWEDSFILAGDLIAEETVEPPEIWAGILPAGGFSVVGAKPKAGKSTFVRCLAAAVAKGRRFMDRDTVQGPVVYLALEEKRSEVKRHLTELGVTRDDPFWIVFGAAPKGALERLAVVIRQRRPVLCVIDTLFHFARIKEANAYAEITNALAPLLAVARRSGCHVLVVHHNKKLVSGEGGDDLLGSTAIFGAVDTALIMVRKADGTRYVYSVQRYGEDMGSTVLRLDAGWVLAAGELTAFEQAKLRDQILEVLHREGPASEALIREVVIGKTTFIVAAVRELLVAHRIRRTGGGKKGDPYLYAVVEDEEEA